MQAGTTLEAQGRARRARGATSPAAHGSWFALVVALSCLFVPIDEVSAGSDPEQGLAFVQMFEPEDYGPAHHQNWDFAQDERGVVFVGNGQGILRFDGANWGQIPTPNGWVALAVEFEAGRLFYGGVKSFGYYQPNQNGVLDYVSLDARLPESTPELDSFHFVDTLSTDVYFSSPSLLVRWRGEDELKTWTPSTRFEAMAVIDEQLFVVEGEVGLMRLDSDRLVKHGSGSPVEASRRAFSTTVRALLPHDGDVLLATSEAGLFLHDGVSLSSFETGVDTQLEEGDIQSAAWLEDGRLAIATATQGLLVLDRHGLLSSSFDLEGKLVRSLREDRQGGLWAALTGGIARLELNQAVSIHGPESGLAGTVWCVARHQGSIYAGTDTGAYRLVPSSDSSPAQFEQISDRQTWSLLSTDVVLLAGTHQGLEALESGEEFIATDKPVRSLLRSSIDPSRAYAGLLGGLLALELVDGSWRIDYEVEGVEEIIATIVEESDGTLWLGTGFEGVLRIRPGEPRSESSRLDRFGEDHGLPPLDTTYSLTFSAGGELVVGTRQGGFRFSPADGGRFEPDPLLNEHLAEIENELFWLAEAENGDLFVRSGETAVLRRQDSGGYSLDLQALGRLPRGGVFGFHHDPGGVAWVASRGGLARYAPDPTAPVRQPVQALVSEVRISGSEEALYGGSGPRQPMAPARLRPDQNALRFSYGLPVFDDLEATEYQIQLSGFDPTWSAWTRETRKDYTNLPGGDYVFEVRARDTYGRVSDVGTYNFTLLPPWYRSSAAYAAYVILASTLLVGSALAASHWRSRQLRERARQLESAVRERTAEVRRQKRRIEEQNEQLAAQTEELLRLDSAKSRFFANISHEFRTPLTLISGPLSDLAEGRHGNLRVDAEEQVNVALRSSRQLLTLVEQLLDTARLESGHLELQRHVGDFSAFVREHAELFRSLSHSRGVDFEIDTPPEPLPVLFDRDQMQKVLFNLLSNAFKFTEPNGAIAVRLAQEPERRVLLSISDTGPGIAEDLQERVFDRFYQVDGSSTRKHPGTGIGLALTRELVELHGGSIHVASVEGQGATFTVELERARDAPPEELAGAFAGPEISFGKAPLETAPDSSLPAVQSGISADDVTTVLVVDDHVELRAFIRRHLEAAFRVVEASNGVEGLEVARRVTPDLIVSDVMMPELDGYGLCDAIRSDPELDFIPIILLTAKTGTDEVVEGIGHGADEYLPKPFDPIELEARVRGIIASRRHLRKRFGAPVPFEVHASEVDVTSEDEAFLQRLTETIEQSLSEEGFTVERLARAMAMDRTALYRRVRALLDESPTELLRRFRLERAAQLLDGGLGSVTEVAYSVGFASLSYFTKCFREQYGLTPSAYARNSQN